MLPAATYTITLENERYFPPPLDETAEQAAAAPRFDPATFGSAFVFRHPTLGEDMRITAAVTAYFEAQGVADMVNAPTLMFQMAWSLAFFDVVGVELPKWFREARDQPVTGELKCAVAAAFRLAQLAVVEKKSATVPDGES